MAAGLGAADAGAAEDSHPVTIRSIDIDVDGNTLPGAVQNELLLWEGKEFGSYADLEKIIKSRAEGLQNRRLFKVFDWTLEETEPGLVDVSIRLVDSFSIYPRPVLKYASDSGLKLGLKVEYFNAFGTLTDQFLEGYWSPYEIKGRYEVQHIPVGPIHLNAVFEQYYGSTRYGNPHGETIAEYKNMYSMGTILADVPLGLASSWSYRFEPVVKGQYGYEFVQSHPSIPDNAFIDEGFAAGFNHGFFSDQVQWVGNFRKGLKVLVMNNNLWYTETGRADSFLEYDVYGYRPLAPWVEVSGRFGGFYAFSGIRDNAGDRLRGVVDYMTYGQWGVFAAAQVNFRVIPSFGFVEVQIRPFADVGYVRSDQWNPGAESWEYCAGSTFIFNLDALPSLLLNMEFGWDFKRNLPEILLDTKLLL